METYNPNPQNIPNVADPRPGAVTFENPSPVKSGSVHGFLFIVQFFALAMLSLSVGTLFFQLINHYIEDPLLSSMSYYTDAVGSYAIKFGIASVIVAAPVYFILAFLLNRYLASGKVSYESRARKSIISVVLVLASITLLIDLVSLVFHFLSGDFSGRFIPKVFVVFMVGGVVLGYYVMELIRKSYTQATSLWNWIFFSVALTLTLIPFFWSFFIIDSPSSTRDKQADAQIVASLAAVRPSIIMYADSTGTLPTNLSDLTKSRTPNGQQLGVSVTPAIIKDIKYIKTGETTYKLCATFLAATDDTKATTDPYAMYDYNAEWKHKKGEQCFDQTIDTLSTSPNMNVVPINQNTSSFRQSSNPMSPAVAAVFGAASSAVPSALLCRDGGGTVLSGTAKAALCSNNASDTWPDVSNWCGGMQWTVVNGSTNNWDFVVRCDSVPECSGPQNLLCNANGCTSSSKTCTSS